MTKMSDLLLRSRGDRLAAWEAYATSCPSKLIEGFQLALSPSWPKVPSLIRRAPGSQLTGSCLRKTSPTSFVSTPSGSRSVLRDSNATNIPLALITGWELSWVTSWLPMGSETMDTKCSGPPPDQT